MIENVSCLARDCSHVEAVRHHQKDVHIVGRGFIRDEGAEDDEARECAGANGEAVDALKALHNDSSLFGAAAEMLQHRRQGGAMQARRQVAARIEIGKCAHAAQAGERRWPMSIA